MSVHGNVVGTEPCPDCGSRDNVKRYETGYAKCFGMGCSFWEPATDGGEVNRSEDRVDPDRQVTRLPVEYVSLDSRGISEETCRRFKYGIGEYNGQHVQIAQIGAVQKVRRADKTFAWVDSPDGKLFGQSLWRPGGKRLVITEGELDCLSYAEATQCGFPVVSVPNGAGGAARSVKAQLEWIESFDEVVFLFDMDEPGQAAAMECAPLLTPGKAFIGQLPRKDPNEVLLELGVKPLYEAPFKAKVYRPDGIVEGLDLIKAVLTPPPEGLSHPWPALDTYLHGMRRGEMTTWIAGTGSGKSQVLREVARHLYVEHGERVGIIALEESNRESAVGQLSLELNKTLHLPEVRSSVSDEELENSAKKILRGFTFYNHFGTVSAEVLLPKIRYMAVSMGIKWIILDHISIMVSGEAAEGDERKRIDQLVTRLRSLVAELNIGLHIVSHLRKASGTPHEEGGKITLQDIRGSGAPGQLSNFVIGLERNQQADDGTQNHTTVRILKNRLTGENGVAGVLEYVRETGRLVQYDNPQKGSNENGKQRDAASHF